MSILFFTVEGEDKTATLMPNLTEIIESEVKGFKVRAYRFVDEGKDILRVRSVMFKPIEIEITDEMESDMTLDLVLDKNVL